MNDADRTIDVSLETDRLEQLLEVPPSAPAQPVVMIEYRNRGVPWWLVVSLIVLVPLVAVIGYQQIVVQTYQRRAAQAAYDRALQAANDKPAAPASREETSKPDAPASTAVPAPAPIVMTAESARAPEVKASSPPAATSEASSQPARSDSNADLKLADTAEPPGPRVRTLIGPLESVGTAPGPKAPAAPAPAGGPNATPAKPVRDDAANTKLASAPVQPGTAVAAAPNDKPASKDAAPPVTPPGATAAAAPAGGPQSAPAVAPNPTPEEFEAQIAEEAARKNAEKAEAQAELLDRMRVRHHEDRVRFHEELQEIIKSASTKQAATEINTLVKRFGGMYDPRAVARAKKIWRDSKVAQAVRVSQIRSLDIPEPVILDCISDNLHEMRGTRNGPRDNYDVRVRAAKLLLKFPVPEELGAPPAASVPANSLKDRGTADSRH